MKRHLKLRARFLGGDRVEVTLFEQSHYYNDFPVRPRSMYCHRVADDEYTWVRIASFGSDKSFWVRGKDEGFRDLTLFIPKDKRYTTKPITMSLKEWQAIKRAVISYNEEGEKQWATSKATA